MKLFFRLVRWLHHEMLKDSVVSFYVLAYWEVGVKIQRGFIYLEPVLMLGVLASFNMSNAALGATMLSLALLALICQAQRKGAKSIIR